MAALVGFGSDEGLGLEDGGGGHGVGADVGVGHGAGHALHQGRGNRGVAMGVRSV